MLLSKQGIGKKNEKILYVRYSTLIYLYNCAWSISYMYFRKVITNQGIIFVNINLLHKITIL